MTFDSASQDMSIFDTTATDLDWYTSEVLPTVLSGDDHDQSAMSTRERWLAHAGDWAEATFDPDL